MRARLKRLCRKIIPRPLQSPRRAPRRPLRIACPTARLIRPFPCRSEFAATQRQKLQRRLQEVKKDADTVSTYAAAHTQHTRTHAHTHTHTHTRARTHTLSRPLHPLTVPLFLFALFSPSPALVHLSRSPTFFAVSSPLPSTLSSNLPSHPPLLVLPSSSPFLPPQPFLPPTSLPSSSPSLFPFLSP